VWAYSYLTRPSVDTTKNIISLQTPFPPYQTVLIEKISEAATSDEFIKFQHPDDRNIDLIEKARPLPDVDNLLAVLSENAQSELAMSHPIYIVGAEELATSAAPLPREASGIRVFETKDDKLVAAYDFSGTAEQCAI
jgi:hypothetical protein